MGKKNKKRVLKFTPESFNALNEDGSLPVTLRGVDDEEEKDMETTESQPSELKEMFEKMGIPVNGVAEINGIKCKIVNGKISTLTDKEELIANGDDQYAIFDIPFNGETTIFGRKMNVVNGLLNDGIVDSETLYKQLGIPWNGLFYFKGVECVTLDGIFFKATDKIGELYKRATEKNEPLVISAKMIAA